jgi:GH24 family phage-related lysozyme (muramidase)
MPMNRVHGSKRGKTAIAGVMAAAVAVGGVWFTKGSDGKEHPAAVKLAVLNIEKWEGFASVAYIDRIASPPICTFGFGDTKGCKIGMHITRPEAETLLTVRVERDFYTPMTKCIKDFSTMPVGVQASAIMGAYNYGVSRWCHSTAAQWFAKGQYKKGCEAATAFNRAGGHVVNGLVHRREMGDAQRLGEAELCLSGIQS